MKVVETRDKKKKRIVNHPEHDPHDIVGKTLPSQCCKGFKADIMGFDSEENIGIAICLGCHQPYDHDPILGKDY